MPHAQYRDPLTSELTPVAIGHEFSGVVTAVHGGVHGLFVGSRVAVEPTLGDGTCSTCVGGKENHCDKLAIMGLTTTGGMIDSLDVPARKCHSLQDNIPLEIGALVEPFAVAWNGIIKSGCTPTETVLVIGTGPIGIATALCLKTLGYNRLVISGRSSPRNSVVRSFGFANILDAAIANVPVETRNLFDGCVLDDQHVVTGRPHTNYEVDLGRTQFSTPLAVKPHTTQPWLLCVREEPILHLASSMHR